MPWTKDTLPPSVKEKDWSDEQKETFCKTANAMLAEGVAEGECIATATKQAEEKKNASQLPKIYYCRHMQPGICKYEDEVVLVDTDALKKMIATGATKPVYMDHQKVDLASLKEKACGYITESFYNELDGWAWFKFIVVDDEGHNSIDLGYKVSNAYRGTQFGQGGTKNNCPFHREILDGFFTHLAIVKIPRYEEADIFTPEEFKAYQENKKRELEELHNSNPTPKGKPMFKMFKNEKKEVTVADADTMIELENGQTLSVGEMLNAVKKNSDEEKKKEMENGDMEVECDGEKMPLKELVNRYNAMTKKNSEKKNADESAEDKEKREKEEKKNADEAEEKKKKEEEEKKNGLKQFDELRNAHENAIISTPQTIEAPANAVARGKAKYGSVAK